MDILMNNNVKIDCTVEEYFRNKNVFITGGTGFLGTVLVEALLSASDQIGNIYLLVRGKYGTDPNERIKRLLAKALFEKHSEKSLKKVIPIVGELGEPNLGIADDKLVEIRQNVNIIYHSAATINFNADLRTSIKTNVIGTLRTLELAKSLRNLSAYIYLSTAFCNCNNRGLIEEKIYPSAYTPNEMIEWALSDRYLPGKIDPKLKEFIGDHPNTYTFTKQLAENLINKEMKGYPVGIVRPSVIYGTYNYPVEGWSGNANSGHLGFLAGYMKGIFRTMGGAKESILDIIPCDYVINASIVMGWYVGTHEISEPEIIHCSSGEVNPLRNKELCSILQNKVGTHPCDTLVWYPSVKIRNDWRYLISFYLFHLFPAILFYYPEKIFQLGKPQHSSWDYMIVFDKGTKAFEYFLNNHFRYDLKNSLRVMTGLNEKDLARYCYDAKSCDWSLLIERCFKGLRQYYFRESSKTTSRHHFVLKLMLAIHVISFISYFIAFFFVGTLFFSTSIAFIIALLIVSFMIWI